MNNFLSIVSSSSDSSLALTEVNDEKKDSNEVVMIPCIENKILTCDGSGHTFSGVAIRVGLRHGKEYALVGCNAWKVLQKFGYDFAIPRPVVSLSSSGGYAVEVYSRKENGGGMGAMSLVILPLSGRWELLGSQKQKQKQATDINTGKLVCLTFLIYF